MRGRTAAAFVLGFALGMLCLGVALWGTGHLGPAPAAVLGAPPAAATAPISPAPSATAAPAPSPTTHASVPPWQPPFDANAMASEAKKIPAPAVEPPPPLLSGGEADRGIPDSAMSIPPHLAMPLAGIDAKKLADTFEDKRDGRKHEALDIPSPRGTPVLAVAEGNVAKLFTSKDGGLTVYQFDDTRTWCYYYAHLDHYANGLTEGTLLRKGEVLGYVGTTGNAPANAPHLHFAIFRLNADKKWWQGTPIDPLPLLR